jgi:hypothetical protein
MSKDKSLVDTILGFANGVAGVCDWLEQVEQGEEPVRAAKRAYKNAQRRKQAVNKRMKTVKQEYQGGAQRPRGSPDAEGGVPAFRKSKHENDEGGVVIDVTPKVAQGARR